jgi:hypothetical protein
MSPNPRGLLPALAVVFLAAAPPASAQEGRFGSANAPTESRLPAGAWNISPSLLYSGSWDDNVLLKGRGDDPRGDFLHVLNPRADAAFIGKRGQFSGSYDGAFLLYRDLNTLNAYDQDASVSARRQVSKHVTLLVGDIFAVSPTTELAQLVGVPFLRTGSRVNEFRTGVEADLTKRTSIAANYRLESVRFDPNTAFGTSLHGGHTHGASFLARHKLGNRTALVADYDRQISAYGGPESFDVQNAAAGFDRTVTEALRIFASAGISRLAASALGPALTSPRYHAGVSQRLRNGSVDVAFDRSFTPSFGLGSASESTVLTARLHMQVTRKVYTVSGFSWRANRYLQVLQQVDPALQSRSLEGSIGYSAQPWVRIEGFFRGTYQTSDIAGGTIDRNRFGVQVITVKPMRIR